MTERNPRRWSVVIPYHNEEAFLGDTLACLAAQSLRGFNLILVDNASTDGSAALAKAAMDGVSDIQTIHLSDARRGQVNALETGLDAVTTDFVAICDADTYYPSDYLANADAAFKAGKSDLAGVFAHNLPGEPSSPIGLLNRSKRRCVAWLWRDQCHTGGYAHTFRTDALRAAGGYRSDLWPWVLFDHELVHRVLKQGRTTYPWPLWCRTSPRRGDRRNVTWTLFERLVYHVSPPATKDWFFYRFLAPRFEKRGLTQLNLREERPWED